jgi:uncharacterized protein (TIGR02391 family)
LEDLEKFDPEKIRDRKDPSITTLEVAIEETLAHAFGRRTTNYKNYKPAATLDTAGYNANGTPLHEILDGLRHGKSRSIALLNQAIASLTEVLEDSTDSGPGRTYVPTRGLDLHSEIARAASQLYRDSHYSNAVEDAVKALNALVRLRSGLEIDGVSLMQQAFSPNKPILKFNELADQSDRDEQLGFMNMFSGAVAGLRNPRAHKFIRDPERALEFIAYVSLLAKLLDGARK